MQELENIMRLVLNTTILVLILLNTSYANIRDGLVGWWAMDEGTGTTTFDSSWNGNVGTLTGSPNWVSGIRSNALNFSGSNDRVLIPNSSALNLTILTISAWVNTSKTSGAIFDNYGNSPFAGYGFEVGETGSGVLGFWSSGQGGWTGDTSATSVSDGKWHHVVVTYGSSTVTFYIDGAQKSTVGSIAAPGSSVSQNAIGNYQAGSINIGGKVDDVRVYNRILTAQEIKDLYNQGVRRNFLPGT